MTFSLTTPPHVPCEPFPEHYLIAVAKALVAAWDVVCSSGFTAFDDEDQTSDEMVHALCAILDRGPGVPHIQHFFHKYFETPRRDAKQRNHNCSSREKMPDLIFCLSGTMGSPRPYRALFVECKVLSESKAIDLYCENGVRRFVEGQYAYRMPHAMMLAYNLTDKNLPNSLDAFFDYKRSRRARCAKDCAPTSRGPASFAPPPGHVIYVTRHERTFDLAPGPIDLHHLWLNISSTSTGSRALDS